MSERHETPRPRRPSGPSGQAKSYGRRREELGGRAEGWLTREIWAQYRALVGHYGTAQETLRAAISAHFQHVFGSGTAHGKK